MNINIEENKACKKAPYVVAVIPCLNEAEYIEDIVTGTRKYVDRVVVIDDGSTDNTADIARTAGAEIISHQKRMGAGAATRDGFTYAHQIGADILVTLDGDGQHDPAEIPLLLEPIISGKADMVIGSRFLRQAKIRAYRKFGIDIITFLVNFGQTVKFTDSQCCFRAHSKKLVDSIVIQDNSFGFSVEILIQARKQQIRIVEVPVSCIYHDHGSTTNPLVHGLSVALSVIKHRIRLLG